MFIKSLRICNTVTGAIMRETSFHKGVNLIGQILVVVATPEV